MTRKQLRALGLAPEQEDEVIRLHGESLQQLKEERDSLREAAGRSEALADEVTRLRGTAEELSRMRLAQRKKELTGLLTARGCNPCAASLLPDTLTEETMQGDPEAICRSLRERYGGFFAEPQILGTSPLTPPAGTGSALTRADIRQMSEDDINAGWLMIRDVLTQPD